MAFDGFADFNTAKGVDASGHETAPEFITRPQLKLDVGSLVWKTDRILELGVGLQYWHNMFGKPADTVPGAKELTPIATVTVHLPMGSSRERRSSGTRR
jgi:hypothetical protein